MEVTSLVRQGIKAGLCDWKRSIWLVSGIMLGLAFYVTVATIGASYSELVRLPFSRIESDLLIQLGVKGKSRATRKNGSIRLPFSNQVIEKERVSAIAKLVDVKKLYPAILLWHQDKKRFTTIAGVDPGDTSGGPAKVLQWISRGRGLQKNGELVVESHYAKFNKLHPGDSVNFGKHEFTIVGVSKIKEGASLAAANYYISIADAGELAEMKEGAVNLLAVSLMPGTETEAIKKEIAELLPGSIVSLTDSIKEMMQGFAKISAVASGLLSITALVFTVFFACWLIIGRQQEKSWQVGLMETLGWQKKDILVRSGAEIFTLAAIGSLGGLGLGLFLATALGNMEVSIALPWNLAPDPTGLHRAENGASMQVPLPIILKGSVFFYGFAVTTLAAVGVGVRTNWRISKRSIRNTLFG